MLMLHPRINYANEKLQQKFTEDVFKTVQQEYRQEGLAWEDIDFKDNVEVLDLIEGKRGLLAVLNEECLIPQSSDATFLSKIKTSCATFHCFNVGLLTRDMFTITHYAGAVSYTVFGFLDRNKDNLPEDLRALLSTSSNSIVATIFSTAAGTLFESAVDEIVALDRDSLRSMLLLDKEITSQPEEQSKVLKNVMERRKSVSVRRDSKSPKEMAALIKSHAAVSRRRSSFMLAETVTTKFKRQLTSLLDTIAATEVQYVRCFKPNANKSSKEFNHRMVVEQLRSSGVIEAITVSRAAYPNHLSHQEFFARFAVLKRLDKNRSIRASRSNTPVHQILGSYSFSSTFQRDPGQQCKGIMDMLVEQEFISMKDLPAGGTKALLYELGKSRVYFALGVQEKLEVRILALVCR
jgi:myosin V